MPTTARRRLAALVVTPVVALTALAGTALPAHAVATVDLEASETEIVVGESVELSWTTSADTVTLVASGAWTGDRDFPTGSETVTPAEPGTYTYTLDATADDDTTATDSVTVVVAEEDDEIPVPGEAEIVEAEVASCGVVRFTNISDGTIAVLYGDASTEAPDDEIELESGESDTVRTERRELDFVAYSDDFSFQQGTLDVPQDCDGAGAGDGDADHPTVAPAAGVGDDSRTE